MAGSDADISSSYLSEDSYFSNESSNGGNVVTDNMGTTNLGDDEGFMPPILTMAEQKWESDREYHESLVSDALRAANQFNVHQVEIETTPLFSGNVLECVKGPRPKMSLSKDLLPSYSFLAKILDTFGGRDQQDTDDLQTPGRDGFGFTIRPDGESASTKTADSRLFVNMNAPWSGFICGSQGSGKSHTLSCMLEAALKSSRLGPLPGPLAGMVFHYDKFTGLADGQICEAAFLGSTGIPVTVLVSPSNFHRMKNMYSEKLSVTPVVVPLLLEEKQLNTERLKQLMAVDSKEGKNTLYMAVIQSILGTMAMNNQDGAGLDYKDFKDRVKREKFTENQRTMLYTRLRLLENFMYPRPGIDWLKPDDAKAREKIAKEGIWSFQAGSLTIVDLSCPFVDESEACAMFNICLSIFLEDRKKVSRIVALDEAHKYMTGTDSSSAFTETLLSTIRQQRHLATRVIIATQEPTISPALLDLSSMTIVHRFTSPAWYDTLKSHIAAIAGKGEGSKRGVRDDLREQIVELGTGEAFIFSPSAMLGVDDRNGNRSPRMVKMGTRYIKVRVRNRLTSDGGRSILAT